MKKEVYNKLKERVENLEKLINGGKGSGNFGHSGRPGLIGGSGDGGGNNKKIEDEIKKVKEEIKALGDYLADTPPGGVYFDKSATEDVWKDYEKAKEKLEKLEKTRIHKKYLDQGLSNIQEKTVAEQEKKIEALQKIKIEYRDAIASPTKDELGVMSRLDKQEKDALEYLEKLKKIESSKKKTNGVTMKKELYNELKKRVDALETMLNGGKGSGNFGHAGRPGEIGGSGGGKTQLQRAAEAEATSGKVGHFAGLQYVDEIYKEKSKKMKDDLFRLKEVKDRDGYVDANDPAHNRLDEIKGQLARAKELAGSNVPDTQRTKLEKLEKLVDDIEEITGWKNSTDRVETLLNGGKGSGNFGHRGRPGEVGGSSSSGLSGISKAVAGSKKNIDRAKTVQEDIEDKIGQKVKKGEEYTALDEASSSRFKYFHGEDGTEYTYDKGNGMITKTNPKTGDQEVLTRQKDKGFQSEYKVGDSYTKGGVTYDVVDGKNGPMAVSKDGKINTELPDKLRYDQTKMIKDTFDGIRDEGIPMSSPRYDAARDAYKRIQERAIETSRKGLDASKAPRMVHEAVEKFLTEIKSPSSSPRVAGYYEEAKGLIRWWSMGNGGMKKPQSSQIKGEIKELKAELDSLYERYRIMTTPKGFRK